MDNKEQPVIEESKKAIITNQFPKQNTNNLSVISLVLGIISLLICWCFILPAILGIIGIIVGTISIAKKRADTKIAIAGLITSVIGLLLGSFFSLIDIISILK